MKFSVRRAPRKWSYGLNACGERPMVLLAVAVLAGCAGPAEAQTHVARADAAHARQQDRAGSQAVVPLPIPRPADVPAAGAAHDDDAATAKTEPAAPASPSACRLALTDAIAIAPSIAPIRGPGACGGEDLVRLEAVVLPDKGRVAVKPAAVLRCGMATAIANWIRNDMAPLAQGMSSRLTELDNFDSFECRGRNRVAGAKLSEHGKANALDVRGLKLANGKMLSLTDRSVTHDLREKAKGSACGRFTTVLGPGSDGYHEDHIHLDLAERHNGYRICHWEVYDSEPVVASPLPTPRPETAPSPTVASREVEQATAQPATPLPAPRPDDAPSADVASRGVEQLKVQPATPPSVSFSPVPLAKQPADVARPVVAKPADSTPDSAKSQTAKSQTEKAQTAKPEKSGQEQPQSVKPEVAAKPTDIKPGVAKPTSRTAMTKPEAEPAATDKKEARVAKSKSRRSRHLRSRARNQPPDLPVLLRRMFD